jgi:hypothetical protein
MNTVQIRYSDTKDVYETRSLSCRTSGSLLYRPPTPLSALGAGRDGCRGREESAPRSGLAPVATVVIIVPQPSPEITTNGCRYLGT